MKSSSNRHLKSTSRLSRIKYQKIVPRLNPVARKSKQTMLPLPSARKLDRISSSGILKSDTAAIGIVKFHMTVAKRLRTRAWESRADSLPEAKQSKFWGNPLSTTLQPRLNFYWRGTSRVEKSWVRPEAQILWSCHPQMIKFGERLLWPHSPATQRYAANPIKHNDSMVDVYFVFPVWRSL